jgi:hypothetical protein
MDRTILWISYYSNYICPLRERILDCAKHAGIDRFPERWPSINGYESVTRGKVEADNSVVIALGLETFGTRQ